VSPSQPLKGCGCRAPHMARRANQRQVRPKRARFDTRVDKLDSDMGVRPLP
jgi:hypothetical protein